MQRNLFCGFRLRGYRSIHFLILLQSTREQRKKELPPYIQSFICLYAEVPQVFFKPNAVSQQESRTERWDKCELLINSNCHAYGAIKTQFVHVGLVGNQRKSVTLTVYLRFIFAHTVLLQATDLRELPFTFHFTGPLNGNRDMKKCMPRLFDHSCDTQILEFLGNGTTLGSGKC